MIRQLPKRLGPTWVEILFSLGCSVLLATDVFVGRASIMPQSAEWYYTASIRARGFHTLGVVVDALFLVSTLVWIVLPALERFVRPVLFVVAAMGMALCWWELNWAAHITSRLFELRELPFRPIANAGLLGAQWFGMYLVFRLPAGKLAGWQSVAVRLGLSVCLLAFQAILWDGVARSTGRIP